MNKLTLFSVMMLSALALNVSAVDIDKIEENIVVNDTSVVRDIDEVVVVAQKESFLLRMQPISSTMFSAQDINGCGTRDIRELSNFVPSFVMPEYGSRLTSAMYIRGIGSRVNNPAVAFYMDGVPMMSRSALNFHTYDLERVDVLRGPQGTLYGQNTEGGLVRLYSLNPMRYQGTDVKISAGSHFYRNVEASHYAKLSDQLALSAAAFYDGQNGFFRNSNTGDRADLMNEGGGRLRLVYQPTDRFSLDWVNDYQYVRQNGFPYGVYDADANVTHAPSTTFQSNYRRNMFLSGLGMKYQLSGVDLMSNFSYQYLKDYMCMDQDYTPVDFMSLTQRQHQNSLTGELVAKSTTDSRWHWTTGTFACYQWLKTLAPVNFGEGITAPIANGIRTAMYNAMLNSMAGRMMQQGMTQDRAMTAAAAAIEAAGGVSMDVRMNVPGLFHTPHFNMGVFHQTDYEISDRLVATIGLRYDHSQVSIDYDTKAIMAMTANVMGTEATYTLTSNLLSDAKDSYDQILPKFGLTYKIDAGNIYATVSKGYRAGGFNIQMFSDILQKEINANSQNAMRGDYDVPHDDDTYDRIKKTIAYKPEESWNYEAGVHLNLFDHKVMLDVAAFYMQLRNQQLSVMAGNYGFGRMMVNAGRSFSCGLEMSARGKAIDNHLSWSVNYGLTHSQFKEFKDSLQVDGNTNNVVVDYNGKRVPYVPMHTLSANLDYQFDFNGSAVKSLTLGVNMYGQGSIYWNELNTSKQNFYAVFGAHADVDFGLVSLSLWGRNLTDAKYNTFVVESGATGITYQFAHRGNPFQIGCDLKIHL